MLNEPLLLNEPTVLLAALDNGQHVQIGRVRDHAAAYDLFERLDAEQQGWKRYDDGLRRAAARKDHFIDGKRVKFYRLRQQGHEFGDVPSYPVSAVRLTNNSRKGNTSMTTPKTPSGIKRPTAGEFSTFSTARSHAKDLNARFGRGHRALKAKDARTYGVIFRPAVANNKQRRVREVI
jgi:hypothetical protein